jgi:hypothetical protein
MQQDFSGWHSLFLYQENREIRVLENKREMNNLLLKCVVVAFVLTTAQAFFVACQDARGNKEQPVVLVPDGDCVGVAPDDVLTEGVKAAIKDYPGVNAGVEKGVITLSGSIEKKNLPELMETLKALRATRINNNLSEK